MGSWSDCFCFSQKEIDNVSERIVEPHVSSPKAENMKSLNKLGLDNYSLTNRLNLLGGLFYFLLSALFSCGAIFFFKHSSIDNGLPPILIGILFLVSPFFVYWPTVAIFRKLEFTENGFLKVDFSFFYYFL